MRVPAGGAEIEKDLGGPALGVRGGGFTRGVNSLTFPYLGAKRRARTDRRSGIHFLITLRSMGLRLPSDLSTTVWIRLFLVSCRLASVIRWMCMKRADGGNH